MNIPQHQDFYFEDNKILFSSNFDSGNCGNVIQIAQDENDNTSSYRPVYRIGKEGQQRRLEIQPQIQDKLEELTKEGCGRVYLYQVTKILHSYTLECGFHHSINKNELQDETNKELILNINQKQFCLDKQSEIQDCNPVIVNNGKILFTENTYQNTGRAILISILDIFDKNPHSRIPNTTFQNTDNLRKQLAYEIARTERFRIENAYSYNNRNIKENN
ncbi:zinc carboxypeptidase family protein, putative [Ichthyophthirius multifiliis]|uniref:Zinc carboxypeptidase family protein, putative n=1 Tax=Ichthyophthirius multifiliis TaxID=5932 RepID=G0QNT5_ICHMU|nr:zinc carboxypeptidase family protein, putative [Ichthyophthirius multifiliis]EGR33126.1 zinc carboxypeptidase family protein, putative [Ichthyophthirius multifiliis]|eukprot:XP_004037112.1 zinc carboxypeptidase family protein, putative [Ichthyophthirius multifiliis]